MEIYKTKKTQQFMLNANAAESKINQLLGAGDKTIFYQTEKIHRNSFGANCTHKLLVLFKGIYWVFCCIEAVIVPESHFDFNKLEFKYGGKILTN